MKKLMRPLEKRLMLDASLIADIGDNFVWLDGADQSSILDAEGDDASSGGAFSGTVATWQDKSGNSNNAIQSNAAKRPTYLTNGINGQASIDFDTSADFLQFGASGINVGTDYTVFTVFDAPLPGTGTWRTLFRGSGSDHHIIVRSDGKLGMYDNGGGAFRDSGFDMDTLGAGGHVMSSTMSGGQSIFDIDSQNVGTSDRQGDPNIFAFGNYQGGNQRFGEVGELLIFKRNLTADEQHDVENYLANKWGIASTNLGPSIINKSSSANTGQEITINSAALSSTDADNTDSRLIYTVSSLAANGILKLNGVILNVSDTFTQADVNNNLLTYMHDGSATATDSFNFTVGDRLATSAVDTFNLNVDNSIVDTPPVLAVNATATVLTGQGATISASELSVTDVDTGAGSLTYQLTSDTVNGILRLNGIDLNVNDTFTQDDINSGLLTYTHDGSVTAADSFDFTVGDAATTLPADTFNFNIVTAFTTLGDVAGKTTGTYTFNAGGETFDAYIDNDGTSSWLLVGRGREGWEFDADGQGTTASVSTNLGVVAGFNPAAYNTTIMNSLINYAGLDFSNVEIRIKRAADIAGTNYQEVRWNPISQSTWTWSFDTANYDITHEVQASALGGSFTDTTGRTRDGNSTPGSDSGNNHQRIFTWGWGSHASQKGFAYGTAIGGVNGNDPNTFLWENTTENHAIPYAEVYIRFTGDQPSVTTINKGVDLSRGTSVTITGANLDTDDVDTADASITYQITGIAGNGTLFRNAVALGLTDTFTQADIIAGLVTYTHDGSATPTDSFDFTVTDGTSTLAAKTYNFNISEAPTTTVNAGAALNQGASVIFSDAALDTNDPDTIDSALTYQITDVTDNGTLYRNAVALGLNDTFTQADITAGLLTYTHDGSVQTADSFGFTVTDGVATLGTSLFNFTITLPSNTIPNTPEDSGSGSNTSQERDDGNSDSGFDSGDGFTSTGELIRSVLNGSEQSAFYGDSLNEIIRENNTFEISRVLRDIDNSHEDRSDRVQNVIERGLGDDGQGDDPAWWELLDVLEADLPVEATETEAMALDLEDQILLDLGAFDENIQEFLETL